MEILSHLVLAILLQLVTVAICRDWRAGALVASCWAIAREITQAEYRWIELYGAGLRANMPWWGGLDWRVWQKVDPWLDWILPTILVWVIAFARSARRVD
jgi:hypothetical protein